MIILLNEENIKTNTKKETVYKCPFCNFKSSIKTKLYEHMETEHEEELGDLPVQQVYFNKKYNKEFSLCIVCKKNHTDFNITKERYERLCNDPKCKEKYRKMFENRMKKKYNTNDPNLLMKDPEHQQKMLENRKISGTYIWSTDSNFKFPYTGTYELDFLKYMDVILNWNPSDIFVPCPIIFYYVYQNKKHFYRPDAFIPSLKLVIEIKSFKNKHYRERDIEIEKLKDKAVLKDKENYNFYKIGDKDYESYRKYLQSLIVS